MYIIRDIADQVVQGAGDSPVVSILGPRQSGKSTLCKELFPHHAYVDMQDIEHVQFAQSDPKGFLRTYTNEYGIVIDEAQYAPHLFAQIKVEVDKDRRNMGRYILSGSQNFLLNERITESLAGRVYIYKLLPLSIHELTIAQLLRDQLYQQIATGFYPGLYGTSRMVDKFFESYFFTYVERDVRSLRNIDNLSLFKKFIQLCIARIGQPLNTTFLANETGISVLTARAWLSLLEASFIIFLLPPYHTNMSKRVVKSPKLYFYDVGLAAHLAGVTIDVLRNQRDFVGQLFENMMIIDLLKQCFNEGYSHQFFFYRDTNQREVDLIVQIPGKTIPIEIKLSATIQQKFFDTLAWFRDEFSIAHNGAVIYGGNDVQQRTNAQVLSWKQAYTLLS